MNTQSKFIVGTFVTIFALWLAFTTASWAMDNYNSCKPGSEEELCSLGHHSFWETIQWQWRGLTRD